MRKHTIDRYTLCAHNKSTTIRCPYYSSRIFQKCTKDASESTHFSSCPKCAAVYPEQGKEVSIKWLSEEETRQFLGSWPTPMNKQSQKTHVWGLAGGGLRWIRNGLRGISGRGLEVSVKAKGLKNEGGTEMHMALESGISVAGSKKTESAGYTEIEMLAEGYRRIIGAPPPSVVDTEVDKVHLSEVETMTTWSRFLDSPLRMTKLGHLETHNVERRDDDAASFAAIGTCGQRAGTRMMISEQRKVRLDGNANHCGSLKTEDQVRESLRLADERLRCARDGRGV